MSLRSSVDIRMPFFGQVSVCFFDLSFGSCARYFKGLIKISSCFNKRCERENKSKKKGGKKSGDDDVSLRFVAKSAKDREFPTNKLTSLTSQDDDDDDMGKKGGKKGKGDDDDDDVSGCFLVDWMV